jgi:hypothetical protein
MPSSFAALLTSSGLEDVEVASLAVGMEDRMRYRFVALSLFSVALCAAACSRFGRFTTVDDPVELAGVGHVIESCKLATPSVYVNDEADTLHNTTPDGCPFTGMGTCSLRDAIGFANRRGTFCDGGHNTHIYLQSVTYTLTFTANRTLEITSETIIHGRGAVVEGAAELTPNTGSVFHVAKGSLVGMSDLTIRHGWGAYGGGIQNDGSVTLTNCLITQNHAASGGGGLAGGQSTLAGTDVTYNTTDGDGGGVAGAWLSIYGGTVSNNQAARGAGIFNSWRTDLQGTTISANASVDGAGLFNDSWASVHAAATTFSFNVAVENGGGIYNATSGQIDMADVHLLDNESASGNGGAIYNLFDGYSGLALPSRPASFVTLVDSEVRQNVASNASNNATSGIHNQGLASVQASAVLSLQNCVVDANVTSGMLGIGGIYNGPGGFLYLEASEVDSNRGGGVGGILNAGEADLLGSTISRNIGTGNVTGFGGVWNVNALKLINTTISNNMGVPFRAGGLFNGVSGTAGKVDIAYSTIAFNNVGVEIFYSPGVVTVASNSIIAKNNQGADCSSPISSSGHNLEGGTTCAFTAPTDRQSVDPLLGPLMVNAPISVSKSIQRATHALLPGSPAIDPGGDTTTGCPATDERGVPRPKGVSCDIGAFEAEH